METQAPSSTTIAGERAAQSLRGAAVSGDDRRLREATADFEAIFVSMMLSSMRKAFPKNEMFHGGQGEEVFQGMLDEQYARKAAHNGGGLGIGKMLYEALKRKPQVDVKA